MPHQFLFPLVILFTGVSLLALLIYLHEPTFLRPTINEIHDIRAHLPPIISAERGRESFLFRPNSHASSNDLFLVVLRKEMEIGDDNLGGLLQIYFVHRVLMMEN